MSEYLKKQAVLEWLKDQQKQQEEKRNRLEIDHPYWEYHEGASDYLSLSVEKIQSGAFDAPDEAPDEEIQRLHAELERIKANNVEVIRLSGAAAEKMQTEIERLRAALERIVTVYEECDCTAKDLYLIAVNEVGSKQPKVENEVHEALSTATESTGQKDADDLIGDWIGERCPKCGADMLGNKVGDKWCSLVGCDYDINAPEGDGNDV